MHYPALGPHRVQTIPAEKSFIQHLHEEDTPDVRSTESIKG